MFSPIANCAADTVFILLFTKAVQLSVDPSMVHLLNDVGSNPPISFTS